MGKLRLLNLEIENAWIKHKEKPDVAEALKIITGGDPKELQIAKMIWTIRFLKDKITK